MGVIDFIAENPRASIALGVIFVYLVFGIVIVKEWERVPVIRFGRYIRTLGGGLSWIEPITSRRLVARPVQDIVYSLAVPAVLTHDNVPVGLTIAVTRYIDAEDVRKTVAAVSDYRRAEEQRALSTVAELIGRRPIDYVFDKRVEFSEEIRSTLQERVKTWGLTIRAVELKDFQIADEAIARSVAMKARAMKEAQAELARAEMQAEIRSVACCASCAPRSSVGSHPREGPDDHAHPQERSPIRRSEPPKVAALHGCCRADTGARHLLDDCQAGAPRGNDRRRVRFHGGRDVHE